MKAPFLRFLAFSGAFWFGAIASLFPTHLMELAFFHRPLLWPQLPDFLHYFILPVMIAEVLRSPVMGLLFVLSEKRNMSIPALAALALVCGATSYLAADALTLAGFSSWHLAPFFRQPVGEYVLLILPIALILLSRLTASSPLRAAATARTDPSTSSG